jgi:large-conductance mechanosensitive channel
MFLTSEYNDLREYVFTNNVIAIATGWGIGNATKDLISRLLQDICVPIFTVILELKIFKDLTHAIHSSIIGDIAVAVGNVTWDFMIWLVVILLTFILLEYVFYRGILGLCSKIKPEDKAKFDISQLHHNHHHHHSTTEETN